MTHGALFAGLYDNNKDTKSESYSQLYSAKWLFTVSCTITTKILNLKAIPSNEFAMIESVMAVR